MRAFGWTPFCRSRCQLRGRWCIYSHWNHWIRCAYETLAHNHHRTQAHMYNNRCEAGRYFRQTWSVHSTTKKNVTVQVVHMVRKRNENEKMREKKLNEVHSLFFEVRVSVSEAIKLLNIFELKDEKKKIEKPKRMNIEHVQCTANSHQATKGMILFFEKTNIHLLNCCIKMRHGRWNKEEYRGAFKTFHTKSEWMSVTKKRFFHFFSFQFISFEPILK